MKASYFITARVSKGAITLAPKTKYCRLIVLGGSCTMNVDPGREVGTVTIIPENEGKPDVLAVSVFEYIPSGHSPILKGGYFLEVTGGSMAHVVLDEHFVPAQDRLCSLYWDSGVGVQIGDEYFLAPLNTLHLRRVPSNLAELRRRFRLLPPDGANLLCRYIVGKAEPDEVQRAADELVAVPSLGEKLASTEAEVARMQKEHKNLLDGYFLQMRDLDAIRQIVNTVCDTELSIWSKLQASFRGGKTNATKLAEIRQILQSQ